MTLFPSALRSDRPPAMSTPIRPLLVLWSLCKRLVAPGPSTAGPVLSIVSPHPAIQAVRPEPTLRWTDPHSAPAGDYAASAIPNAKLDIAAVPQRGESWEAVSDFALSYDGYAYWDDLSTLAGGVLQRWTRRRSLPDTLDELRGCLFYEQRRWHHFGEVPTGRSAEYMWAMVAAIGALALPFPATTDPPADPRRATAPEAHVKLVATRAVALRPVPSPPLTMRPLPARGGRLVPVPAAEAHVRLVTSIEEEASVMARHPSRYTARRSSSHASADPIDHRSGNPADHPAMNGAVRDLKPMPSADPLPKPPVIVRRARRAMSGTPNRPGGALNTTRTSGDPWSSNGSRWKLEKVSEAGDEPEHPSDHAEQAEHAEHAAVEVTPLCHEFFVDDTGYDTWVEAHPQGFVLNQPRARAKAPTLHRAACSALSLRGEAEARSSGTLRVCGPNVDALRTWSMARGTGEPTACRRCCP